MYKGGVGRDLSARDMNMIVRGRHHNPERTDERHHAQTESDFNQGIALNRAHGTWTRKPRSETKPINRRDFRP